MSHFLARLVERARGTAPRVEPLVVPRFAPTPIAEIASEVETPPPERNDQQPTVEEKSLPRAVVQQQAPAEKAETKTLPELEEALRACARAGAAKLLVPLKMVAEDSTVFVRPSPSDRPTRVSGKEW